MKYLLHIDTSADTCTVMLSGDGVVLGMRVNNEARAHAATVNIMIDDVLTGCGSSFADVNAVVVCSGPGSYTGLRIGMATAKGLCYSLDKPLIATDKLTLLAYKTWLKNGESYNRYVALLTAREGEYFIAVYDSFFVAITLPVHVFGHQLSSVLGGGSKTLVVTDISPDLWQNMAIPGLIPDFDTVIDNNSWAKYALNQYDCNNNVNLASAEPLYLKQVYTHK